MSGKTVPAFATHAKWVKEGLRPYFKYRDLGIRDATNGKVLAHIIRAAAHFCRTGFRNTPWKIMITSALDRRMYDTVSIESPAANTKRISTLMMYTEQGSCSDY